MFVKLVLMVMLAGVLQLIILQLTNNSNEVLKKVRGYI